MIRYEITIYLIKSCQLPFPILKNQLINGLVNKLDKRSCSLGSEGRYSNSKAAHNGESRNLLVRKVNGTSKKANVMVTI